MFPYCICQLQKYFECHDSCSSVWFPNGFQMVSNGSLGLERLAYHSPTKGGLLWGTLNYIYILLNIVVSNDG